MEQVGLAHICTKKVTIRNIGVVDITLWSESPEKQLIGSMNKTILIFEYNNIKATVLAWY